MYLPTDLREYGGCLYQQFGNCIPGGEQILKAYLQKHTFHLNCCS